MSASLGCDAEFLDRILLAAPLHDIGKVRIPDRILFKPGPLTADERAIMQEHCRIGERILRQPHMGRQVYAAPLCTARRNATTPSRCWTWPPPSPSTTTRNGTAAVTPESGWREDPPGSAGHGDLRRVRRLDLEAPYKDAYSEQVSLEIIAGEVGQHFDPAVHRAFTQALPVIRDVRRQFADKDS